MEQQDRQQVSKIQAIIIIILIIIAINIGLLNYVLFFAPPKPTSLSTNPLVQQSAEMDKNQSSPVASPSSKIVDSCYPYSCVDLIKQATGSSFLSTKISATPTPTGSLGSNIKEYFVPLGSGEISTDTYTDVAGVGAYIDSTKYGKIKTVTFEVSMHIPTSNGRVYAVISNDTDKHILLSSEVSMEGDTSKLLISSPVQLDSGNKLYKVQMKNTLRATSLLDQARIHIILE
jgi:hypothetical protein